MPPIQTLAKPVFPCWMRCALGVVLMLVPLCGCRSIQNELDTLHAQGRYQAARRLLEDPRTRREVYGQRDAILWKLETASVNLACGDYAAAVELLDQAETFTAYNYERTGGEVLTQWALNDAAAAYAAQPYEDLYVNVFKQLAFLARGDLNNAAAESRRMLDKSKALGPFMREYLRRAEAADTSGVVREGSARFRGGSRGRDEYITSPLGAYLAALIAAKNGNPAGQDEAATRLRQAVGEQRSFIGAVKPEAFESVATLLPESFDAVVVAFSGRGPIKEAKRVDAAFAPGRETVIPFPTIRRRAGGGVPGGSSRVVGARVEFSSGERSNLDLVEDLGTVVAENYLRMEPAIYSRTIARIAVKAGLVAGAAYGVHSSRRDNDLTALTVLAGLAFIALTEQPDLRSWVMLPGQAWVGAVKVPTGAEQARVVYTLAGGREVVSPWQPIRVTSTAPATVITHTPE